mgnify:CR=1 FL=1
MFNKTKRYKTPKKYPVQGILPFWFSNTIPFKKISTLITLINSVKSLTVYKSFTAMVWNSIKKILRFGSEHDKYEKYNTSKLRPPTSFFLWWK